MYCISFFLLLLLCFSLTKKLYPPGTLHDDVNFYIEKYLQQKRRQAKPTSRNPPMPKDINFRIMGEGLEDDIPEFFDARKKWPECKSISKIMDQGNCSSCWAISATTTATDRYCIEYSGAKEFFFSPQELLNCCDYCLDPNTTETDKCYLGGSIYKAVEYIYRYGLASTNCLPYNVKKVDEECSDRCTKSGRQKIAAVSFYTPELVKKNINVDLKFVQREIMNFGPVQSKFTPPANFVQAYSKGVYILPRDELIPANQNGHSVKIIGWGTEKSTPYWLVANSWGTNWGKLGGFMKIIRGRNNMGIEELFVASDMKRKNIKYITTTRKPDGSPRWSTSASSSYHCCIFLLLFTVLYICIFHPLSS